MKVVRWIAVLVLLVAGGWLLVVGFASEAEAEPAEGELETFVPSEKLPADSSISFPVDI